MKDKDTELEKARFYIRTLGEEVFSKCVIEYDSDRGAPLLMGVLEVICKTLKGKEFFLPTRDLTKLLEKKAELSL